MHRRFLTLVALSLALSTSACSLSPDDGEVLAGGPTWVDAWGAAPSGAMPNRCVQRATPSAFPQYRARAQTLRYAVRPSVGGSAVRVRLSNRFGKTPLVVSHVTVARAASGAAIAAGTSRDALFNRGRAVTIAPGAEATSDDVSLGVGADTPVAISIALTSGGPLTWHPVGSETTYATRAGSGDRTLDTRATAFTSRLRSFAVLAGLEVRSPAKASTIVAFGDSLTDGGVGTTSNNWVEVLAKRLRSAGEPRGVVNAGIACNALLSGSSTIGLKAADRFAADVLDRRAVSHVILFLGTNDLHGGATSTAVIAALSDLAQRARAAGIKAIGATVIPENGSGRQRTATRQAVNQWIRTTRQLDGFIDFDAAIRSSGNTAVMNPRYRGDNVHPNARGQVAMGNVIRLSLFE